MYPKQILNNNSSVATLSERYRRNFYRSHHRGKYEIDLLLGRFAEKKLMSLSESELEVYEHLLEQADDEVLNWFLGRSLPHELSLCDLVQKIRAFHEGESLSDFFNNNV